MLTPTFSPNKCGDLQMGRRWARPAARRIAAVATWALLAVLSPLGLSSAFARDLPEDGELFFIGPETKHVGVLRKTEHAGRPCLRGTNENQPQFELFLIASRQQDGQSLALSFLNLENGRPYTTGYVKFSDLQRHPELGEGYYGELVQTHSAVDGELQQQDSPKSARVFLRLLPSAGLNE